MSDNFFDDDFVRLPGVQNMDASAAFAEAHRIHDSTPNEVHEQHAVSAARALTETDIGRSLFSESGGAVLVENPEDQARIEKAILADAIKATAPASTEALKQATQQELGQTTGMGTNDAAIRNIEDLTNQSTGKMAGETTSAADAAKKQGAPQPTEMESALAAIRMSPERQNRLVISGDAEISRRFYDKLAARGQLLYQGGVPVINLTRAKAIRTLQEVAKEVNGSAVHAVNLKLDRDGGGGYVKPEGVLDVVSALTTNARTAFDNIKAGLYNNIGLRHEIDVIVVGKPDVVKGKLEELNKLASTLVDGGHLPKESVTKQENGERALVVPENGGPVELKGTATLYEAVSTLKTKVEAFTAERMAQAAELKAFEDEKRLKSMTEAKAKATPEADPASTTAKAEKPNEHTTKLAASLDLAFQDANLLHANTGKNQVEAMSLLNQFRGLKDSNIPELRDNPKLRELQTLPDESRQKAVVQLAALITKVNDKEFGAAVVKQLDGHEKGTSSIREKVDLFVALEAERTPNFAAKAAPLLKDLVERKLLTETQAEGVTDKIAKAVEAAASAKTQASAPKGDAETTSAKPVSAASEASVQATGGTPGSATSESASKTPASSESGASNGADKAATKDSSTPAASKAEASEPTSSLAAQAHTRADAKDATVPVPGESAKSGAQTAQGGSISAPHSTAQAQSSDSTPPSTSASSTQGLGEATTPSASSAKSAAPLKARDATSSQSSAAGQSEPLSASESQRTATTAKAVDATSSYTSVAGPREQTSGTAGSNSVHATSTDSAAQSSSTQRQPAASSAATLRDTVEHAAATGPGKLSDTQAYSLVASLDAIRTKPLAALDAGDGNKPTQTLVRVEGILKELESGRMGAELKAMAKDLAEPVQRWGQQDAQRYEKSDSAALGNREAVVQQVKSAEPAWHGAASESSTKQAPAATSSTAQAGSEKATGPSEAAVAAKEQALQRQWETESAGGKLAQMMSNPPGAFLNRDKSWNETNIQKAAQEVLRMDPEAVGTMTSTQRTKAAVYSAWVAENAHTGKLPGFTSAEGKAVANQLVEQATTLWSKMDPDAALPKDVQTHLQKADNMVSAHLKLERDSTASNQSSSATAQAANQRTISPQAANALAKDLVHAVYRQPELSEAQAKYFLKNASNLTPDAIKSLDPQLQAKTAAALSTLTEQVRNGAMGEVALMPNSVQKHLSAAEGAADTLLTALNKDPAMKAGVTQAQTELSTKGSSGTPPSAKASDSTQGTASSTGESSKGSSRIPNKSSGPSLER